MIITIKTIGRIFFGSRPVLRAGKLALLLSLCLGPGSAGAAGTGVTRARYVMGTVCEITARGPGADQGVAAAFEELERWDRLLSLYKEDSEASRMNREAAKAPFPASADLWEAVSAALEMARRSEGSFDPTLQPRGYMQVRLDPAGRTVRFMKAGLRLDFGGIGKGLALDHAVRRLRASGVSEALLNFGGQVSALGSWTVESAAGGFILPGDRVDVVLTVQNEGGSSAVEGGGATAKYSSATVMQNVKVLAIDQSTRAGDDAQAVVGATATLEVRPQDAVLLAQAKSEGELSLSLRSYADTAGPSGATRAPRAVASASRSVRVYRGGEPEVVTTP